MILAHVIALDATAAQEQHFRKACGVARLAYNWALAEWKRKYEAGERPSAYKLKIKWNEIRRSQFPFTLEVTKCAGSQAILNLGVAFGNFFRDLKKPKGVRKVRYPCVKKKGVHDSFSLWNDQFAIDGTRIRIPNLGWVRLTEPLRIAGKIMGAVVKRECDRWFVSVQVEVPDPELPHTAPGSVVGIDLGISTHLSLSQPLPDGRTKIENPQPRRAYARRQRKLQRRISRQELVRRRANAKRSKRQARRQAQLRQLHYRIGCIRKDAIHKATTVVASAFETIVIEDLNVSGMSKNHALAGSVLDAAFGEIGRQLAYKTKIAGGRVVIADRFFPSSKTCSDCGHVVDALPLHVREWMCPVCGRVHDRDTNAAINLELVGRATPEPAQMPTCGDMEALAVEQSATKLPWMNRKLDRRTHVRTN